MGWRSMIYFTDSPYERLMQEIPRSLREADMPPVLPETEPCRSCPYRQPVCIGVLCKLHPRQNKEDHHASIDR